MVHVVQGATAVSLTPPEGEGYIVKDVLLYNTGDNYATIITDRATVGYFRAGMTLGNHLPFPDSQLKHSHGISTKSGTPADKTTFSEITNPGGNAPSTPVFLHQATPGGTALHSMELEPSARVDQPTVLKFLSQRGLFGGYPVPSGKIWKIDETPGSSAVVVVIYEVWDARDIRPDMPNGPEAKEYIYINYGTTGATLAVAGPTELDTSDSPTEFPAFPFGDSVPANTEIEILGVLASPVQLAEATAAAYAATKKLKFQKERTVLFDKDANGLPYIGLTGIAEGDFDRIGAGYSLGGNLSDVDPRPPLMFDPPLKFSAGEELKVSWELAVNGSPTGLLVADQQVGLIQRVRRL